MPKYAIELAYDGSEFCGWQTQRGTGQHENTKPSVEEHLVQAIHELCGGEAPPNVISSGRTDAGVHASGQVAEFSIDSLTVSEANLLRGLNYLLPDSIQIHKLGPVPDSFRANRSVKKQYSYYFQIGPSNLPHLKSYTMWNRYDLNGDLMNQAVEHLVGEHDFFSFCAAGANVSSTIRTILEAEVTRESIPMPGCADPDLQYLWRVRLVGTGFLKQMVRSIAGTLKQIGEQRRPAEDMQQLLKQPDRAAVGPTAPANGLWLDKVWYKQQERIDFLNQCPER